MKYRSLLLVMLIAGNVAGMHAQNIQMCRQRMAQFETVIDHSPSAGPGHSLLLTDQQLSDYRNELAACRHLYVQVMNKTDALLLSSDVSWLSEELNDRSYNELQKRYDALERAYKEIEALFQESIALNIKLTGKAAPTAPPTIYVEAPRPAPPPPPPSPLHCTWHYHPGFGPYDAGFTDMSCY